MTAPTNGRPERPIRAPRGTALSCKGWPQEAALPSGLTPEAAAELRARDPQAYLARAGESMARHMRAMLEFQREGAVLFDYGNSIRPEAERAGVGDFAYPGFVPAFKDNDHLVRWLQLAQAHVQFQGLPARICWLGYGERAIAGRLFNDLVASGRVTAPIVIGRDHLDSGSVASPNRETESMRDGSDAIADWPILNALLNTAAGASWVSVHHGGGVGIGYSIHAGMVVVADGTPDAARRLERVLTTDPGTGIMRHADAGYPEAIDAARRHGLNLPGLTGP